MAINQALANQIMLAGAFGDLDSWTSGQMSEAEVIGRIEARYRLQGEDGYDTAGFVLYRYSLYRNAGLKLDRRTDNSTAGQQFLPRVPGCPSPYYYTAVVEFYDSVNDVSFTKPFSIQSQIALGRMDVMDQVQAAAENYTELPDTNMGGEGDERRLEIIGTARITAAGRCVQDL